MTELEYYPSFTSYSDNHGNTADDLLKDTTHRSVRFTDTTLRPGDRLEMRVQAIDPRGRSMSLTLRPTSNIIDVPVPPQTLASGEEAVFTVDIGKSDVKHGSQFYVLLTTEGTEYHRMNGPDQMLHITYTIEPPVDY